MEQGHPSPGPFLVPFEANSNQEGRAALEVRHVLLICINTSLGAKLGMPKNEKNATAPESTRSTRQEQQHRYAYAASVRPPTLPMLSESQFCRGKTLSEQQQRFLLAQEELDLPQLGGGNLQQLLRLMFSRCRRSCSPDRSVPQGEAQLTSPSQRTGLSKACWAV